MSRKRNTGFFEVDTAYNDNWNSPWDSIWYEGDDLDLGILLGELPLAAIWKAPVVKLQKRKKRPDFFVFQSFYAVNQKIANKILEAQSQELEFLPLKIQRRGFEELFVIHPLSRANLDEHAIYETSDPGGNITTIKKYSIDLSELNPSTCIFRVRHPPGSNARDAGIAWIRMIVSDIFKKLVESQSYSGIVFNKI